MPLDPALFSPEEWQTYQELGRRFDPEDAIAQADSTLLALSGSTRALMAHGFLLEDQATLRAARHELDEVHHGGGEGPVDRDAVPVLAGLVITLAREADKAAPKGDSGPPGPSPEQIAWERERDACKAERGEQGRTALKSAGLLALGVGGLVLAGERDSVQHTQANSKLAAIGVILAVVAFFSLTRALVLFVVGSIRLGRIKRREPVVRR